MKLKHKSYSILFVIIRSVQQYLKTSKLWALLEHSVSALNALLLFISVVVNQRLFDLIANIGHSQITSQQIALNLALVALVIISQQVIRGIDKYLLSYISYKNVGLFMAEFMAKLSRIAPIHFEDTDFLETIDKTKRCIEYEVLGYFSSNCVRLISYYGVFFISFGIYFFNLSPTLPLIIFISFIPAVIGHLMQIKVFMQLEEESAPLRRQVDYYKGAITSQQTFKETRTLGAYHYFINLFNQTLAALSKKRLDVERKIVITKASLALISFIGFGVATLMLFNSTVKEDMSIGTFVAVFAALSQIFSMAEEIVSVYVNEASESIGQITNYFKLLDMKEVSGHTGQIDLTKGISVDQMSFQYPNSHQTTLKNISLTLEHNSSIAIVGENGAGKSTLVRLLIGLYHPSKGNVFIGGLDTRTTHPTSLYQETSAVFQNFMRYKMTLFENVIMSDYRKNTSSDEIHSVLDDANFNNHSIQLDTMLSTEFGGIDLSGGQWQRLAIARGLYKSHQFIVLDEPTAAIDPIEEELIFNQFNTLSKDKTTIFVTHRLASAKFAKRILVVDNGQIIEIGTHDELLQQNGHYAKMWRAQASWYVRDNT